MAKILYLLFMALTYFMAGMYRSAELMTFATTGILLFFALFILSHASCHNISASLENNVTIAKDLNAVRCTVLLSNTGWIPVSNITLTLLATYDDDTSIHIKKQIQCYAPKGNKEFSFVLCLPYCGRISLKLTKLEVQDPLRLFHAKQNINAALSHMAILPDETTLKLSVSSYFKHTDDSSYNAENYADSGQSEIRQLREYLQGEPARHLHWKQSARMDKLFIKEFEQEKNEYIPLVLLTNGEKADVKKLDAFYRLLAALIRGFHEITGTVRVYTYNAATFDLEYTSIYNSAQLDELLCSLYNRKFGLTDTGEPDSANLKNLLQHAIYLDTTLTISTSEIVIKKFHEESFHEESFHEENIKIQLNEIMISFN